MNDFSEYFKITLKCDVHFKKGGSKESEHVLRELYESIWSFERRFFLLLNNFQQKLDLILLLHARVSLILQVLSLPSFLICQWKGDPGHRTALIWNASFSYSSPSLSSLDIHPQKRHSLWWWNSMIALNAGSYSIGTNVYNETILSFRRSIQRT